MEVAAGSGCTGAGILFSTSFTRSPHAAARLARTAVSGCVGSALHVRGRVAARACCTSLSPVGTTNGTASAVMVNLRGRLVSLVTPVTLRRHV